MFHEHTKHIEIDCRLVREKIQVGHLKMLLCFFIALYCRLAN